MSKHDVPVLMPENVNTQESLAAIKELKPDLLIVVAYGQILKKELLSLPTKGCINLHASILPKYRGAGPIQWAIANGDKETGVSVMYMNERLDAGDVLATSIVPIDEHDTAGIVHDKLAVAGVSLMCDVVDEIAAGTAVAIPQNEEEATYAPKLKRSDGHIDWSLPATAIYNRIRGFNPWPACHSGYVSPHHKDRRLKIQEARVEGGEGFPGRVIEMNEHGPLVATGNGALRLREVQPEGKRRMSGRDFVHGHQVTEFI
jgi:methionyl-tRNA formyltransferase